MSDDRRASALAEPLPPALAALPCWSCRGPVVPGDPFCATCKAVQPPAPVDHFTRLGLPVGFMVDAGALDAVYFSGQRRLHPDRFRTRAPREQAFSQAQAAALNDAYEVLKSPVRRGGYLLALAGAGDPTREEGTVRDPELLMQAMEDRERLEEADCVAALDAMADVARSRSAEAAEALATAFARAEHDLAARLVLRLKYLDKLADEMRRKRTQFQAAR